MSQHDPNQAVIDAKVKFNDFIERRASVLVDFLLTKTLQDTKVILVMQSVGMDPEATVLRSVQKEIAKRLSKGDTNAVR
jgi:hypothetical protein